MGNSMSLSNRMDWDNFGWHWKIISVTARCSWRANISKYTAYVAK